MISRYSVSQKCTPRNYGNSKRRLSQPWQRKQNFASDGGLAPTEKGVRRRTEPNITFGRRDFQISNCRAISNDTGPEKRKIKANEDDNKVLPVLSEEQDDPDSLNIPKQINEIEAQEMKRSLFDILCSASIASEKESVVDETYHPIHIEKASPEFKQIFSEFYEYYAL